MPAKKKTPLEKCPPKKRSKRQPRNKMNTAKKAKKPGGRSGKY